MEIANTDFIDPRMEIANLVLIPAEQNSQHTACRGKRSVWKSMEVPGKNDQLNGEGGWVDRPE